jgi:putative transposase
VPLLASIRLLFPWVRHVFADGGYAGEKLRSALTCFGRYTIEIIRRSDAAKGFELLPRRLGDRANLRLVEPQQAPGKGLRGIHCQRGSLDHDRERQAFVATPGA